MKHLTILLVVHIFSANVLGNNSSKYELSSA